VYIMSLQYDIEDAPYRIKPTDDDVKWPGSGD
jgi:hypothetical protein